MYEFCCRKSSLMRRATSSVILSASARASCGTEVQQGGEETTDGWLDGEGREGRSFGVMVSGQHALCSTFAQRKHRS